VAKRSPYFLGGLRIRVIKGIAARGTAGKLDYTKRHQLINRGC